jgi:4-hydroxythreonine-4-phosphate dehydrogenase
MNKGTEIRPVLAITMGDPAGIGPEIAFRAMADPDIHDRARLLVIGNAAIMEEAGAQSGLSLSVRPVEDPDGAGFDPGVIDVIDLPLAEGSVIRPGEISAAAGDLAFRAVKIAIDLAMDHRIDGIVTGPLNKESLNLAGHNFSGHTEILAHYTGSEKYAMLLAEDNFRVIHVSTHVSLRKACDLVKKGRILDVIGLMDEALRKLGLQAPRIGVAGLNPHSGDGGLFGDEEILEIIPAIEEARSAGLNVTGPVPPDTLFALARGGRFDGCVAMYHDQGHIPFKFLGFDWDDKEGRMRSVRGVNISLGLPVIRTSVDHGTAFEIAGKGLASPQALLNAIDYAVLLHSNKTERP